jgi:hypothetical protein
LNYKIIINQIGDDVRLPYGDDGMPYCPICGAALNWCLAYHDDGCPSEEICPGCNTQFGDDDLPPRELAGMSTDNYFNMIRLQWLNQEGWKKELIDQMRDVLGIEAKDLRPE